MTLRERLLDTLRSFMSMQLAFASLLLPLRVYEFVGAGMSNSMPEGIVLLFISALGLDIFFFAKWSLIVLLPYLVISLLRESLAKTLLIIASTIFVAAYLMLDQYFFVTFLPLGSDLFGYSWSDIQLTVGSSGGFGLLTILPFLIFIGATVMILVFFGKRKVGKEMAITGLLLIVLISAATSLFKPGAGDFNSEREYDLAVNKVEFFASHTIHWVSEGTGGNKGLAFQGYPLLHVDRSRDVLVPFLKLNPEKPNLVFLIVEGLGRAFVGDGAEFGGFTPFIDSLTKQSLYWENFLSSSGRTFGVLPGLMGSLPYGENGFMEMGYKMPAHITLISLLNDAGYHTAYYYGGDISFDQQNVFLERQNIGRILNESNFGPGYSKSASNEQGFTWGYADGDLFKRSLEIIDEDKTVPRLDIYMTLSTHEPFLPPNLPLYEQKFHERLSVLPFDPQKKKDLELYKQQFASLLYTDDMLRLFFETYRKREDFKNTIFFITGDHRIVPMPSSDPIDRFHVPFIIYSPIVRQPVRFSSVSSHLDVVPSLLALLHNRYRIPLPDKVSWLGDGIDTMRSFRNIHSLPIMRNKNQLIDYVDRDHYLAGDDLYLIQTGLNIIPLDDEGVKREVESKLTAFKELNNYVCTNDKIYPMAQRSAERDSAAADDSLFAVRHLNGLNSDQLYALARSLALEKKYDDARLVCRHMLRTNPDYHDARTLMGLTFAWEGRYGEAEPVYREVLRRVPHYPDAVAALADIELWQQHYEVALEFLDNEVPHNPRDKEILFRKAKTLYYVGRTAESAAVLDTILKIDPSFADAKDFRNRFFRKAH
ncbi:MAG: sulfatase-like hydrolase/transferase [Bacteroidota bacterium]